MRPAEMTATGSTASAIAVRTRNAPSTADRGSWSGDEGRRLAKGREAGPRTERDVVEHVDLDEEPHAVAEEDRWREAQAQVVAGGEAVAAGRPQHRAV
jgi:hypothetical protein